MYVLPESKHNTNNGIEKSWRKIIEIVRRPQQFSCQSVGWFKERKLSRSVFHFSQIICTEWILTAGVIFQCYTYSPQQSLLSVRAPCRCEYLSLTEIWDGEMLTRLRVAWDWAALELTSTTAVCQDVGRSQQRSAGISQSEAWVRSRWPIRGQNRNHFGITKLLLIMFNKLADIMWHSLDASHLSC